MLPPCRDDSSLQEQLDLGELPNGLPWEGAIAYLDRDGVLNRGSADYINHPDEVSLLPGAANAMAELRRSGFRICVITNQSPIGRGLWGHNRLRDVHERLRELLILEDNDAVIDLLLYSPYAPWEGSWARKPNPGMLEAGRQLLQSSHVKSGPIEIIFGEEWSERPSESDSVLVGDMDSDISAGIAHGVRSLLCNADVGLSDVLEQIIE